MKSPSYIHAVLILRERNKLMKSRNKHHGLVLSSTFVGLVCGLVLTHQQAYAAQTPSVSHQDSQITAVAAPNNNLSKTAAVNKDYSVENENIANPAASGHVIPNTYSSWQTNATTKQDNASLQTTNSDATAAVATVPVANVTATSTNPGNNNSANPATSSPSQDTGNSTSTPVAASDNQTKGNSNTTSAASEQSDTNIIAQGTWGTSKWEFTHENDDYILHFHEGKMDNGSIFVKIFDNGSNQNYKLLTKITIDPGVIANEYSSGLFDYFPNLRIIEGLNYLDTSNVIDMSYWFHKLPKLQSIDVSHLNTSQVTNMWGMFAINGLKSLDISNFNTKNVKKLDYMFAGSSELTYLKIGNNIDTTNVSSITYMFQNMPKLTVLDLSGFDTSHINNISDLFSSTSNLRKLILGPNTIFNNNEGNLSSVPIAGTKIPGTDKVVTAPYWVATSGYQQGKLYTSAELMQMTGRDQITTYEWDSQIPYQETIESKLVTRTINVHYPDGQMKIFQDTVHLSRNIKVKADGSKIYDDWSQDQWKSYDAPQIAGYQANQSKIPAQTVDSNTTDTTIDILYEPIAQTIVIQYLDQGQVVGTQKLIGYTGETLIPNYHAPQGYEITSSPQPNITVDATGKQIIQVNVSHKFTQSSETLTKTRTIIIHFPNSTTKTYQQVAFVKRMVAVDQVTGSKNYGPWHNDSWDEVDIIPILDGYTANQNSIAAKEVTAETENETIDIFYVQK